MFHNKKFMITLISILSCISLLSVGYASWTIVSGFDEAHGTITADDVLFSNDYVDVSKSSNFSYCSYGFVDSQNNLTNKMVLSLKVTLKDLTGFKNKYSKDSNSLLVEIELKHTSNYPLFKDNNSIISVSNNIEKALDESVTPIDKIENRTESSIKTSVSLNDVLVKDTYVFNADYIFVNNASDATSPITASKTNTFKQQIFKEINIENLFNVNVKLSSLQKSGGAK